MMTSRKRLLTALAHNARQYVYQPKDMVTSK